MGTPILGIFNILSNIVAEIFPLSHFPGVLNTASYIVRSHSSRKISEPLQSPSLITLKLGVREYDILTAYPLSVFEVAKLDGVVMMANLGLVEKMAGAAAIVTSEFVRITNNRILLDTRLKSLGVIGKSFFLSFVYGTV